MRLWHYKLISVLPKKQLISQWRECIAIKRQWEKSSLKHPLVRYVMNYNKKYFRNYIMKLVDEMNYRKIKYNDELYKELIMFSASESGMISYNLYYPEHNNRYLTQCYYNLQEKYDRGMITDEEYKLIQDKILIELGGII